MLGSIIGGFLGLAGANKASKAQTGAANQATELQRQIYQETTNRLAPFVSAGNNALSGYVNALSPMGDLSMSPAAMFALEQGRDTIEAGAAGAGNLFSGRTAEGLERMRFGMAQHDRDNQLNRLAGLAGMGQAAAAGQADAGQNFASSASQNILSAGSARSAGIMGGVNAINDGIGTIYGYQTMNRLIDRLPQQRSI